MSPIPAGPGAAWGPVLTLGTDRGTQELLAGFSLLGELEEEDDEEEEKLTPVSPGGLVAVFCPVRLFRQTGQLSCFVGRGKHFRGRHGQGWGGPCGSGHPPAHLLQPGHDAAIMEEVVAGQLPHTLTQLVVVLAHGALQPGACGEQGTPVTHQPKVSHWRDCPSRATSDPGGERERLCPQSCVPGEQRGHL